MQRVENKTACSIFLTKFDKLSHAYSTIFSAHSFLVPTLKLKRSKYRVSIRGPLLWNNVLIAAEKNQESQVSLENKLLKFNDFSLKIKGLDDKTLTVFCKFLPVT